MNIVILILDLTVKLELIVKTFLASENCVELELEVVGSMFKRFKSTSLDVGDI